MEERFNNLIENFKSYKVLVVGDAILDTYIKGYTDRICREAPVPVINVEGQEHECGGASNTAINVANLGATTYFLSVIGKDENGRELLNVLQKNNVNTDYIIMDSDRSTLAKKRITASSNILLRIDQGNADPVSEDTADRLNEALDKLFNTVDAVIVSDYGYGVITNSVIRKMEKLRSKKSMPLIIDSKHLEKFRKLRPTAVKPNYEEFLNLLSLPKAANGERIHQVLENEKKLFELTGAQYITQTIDIDGTLLFQKNKEPYHVQSVPQDPKNAIGAGDTFIGALCLGFCAKAPAEVATEIAAAAASIVIQREGTVGCSNDELKVFFEEEMKYCLSLTDLEKKVQELKSQGKKIVFTNGCFDILHRGHVTLLSKARELGDVLIVGINSDDSIRRLKGSERPINSLEDRVEVLASLYSVNLLISFEEDSPAEIIKAIKPDVFVKGGDYTVNSIPEGLLVKQLGGEVKTIPFVNDRSTTTLIKKIRRSA